MRQAERKALQLTVDIPADAIVPSDGELITLALQNILGNAVKYSHKGAVRISTAKRRQEANHDSWELSVSDEGPGIAREHVGTESLSFQAG